MADFVPQMAELSSWYKDCMAYRIENIYYLTLYRKPLLTVGLEYFVIPPF